MTQPQTIIKPNNDLREPFLRMLADYEANEPASEKIFHYARGRADFNAYIESLMREERGENLPKERPTPCTHRWLIKDNEIVGTVRIRHNINSPFLAEEGGHIGYDVPPSHRRRGYGVACLNAGLEVARQLGLEKVLLTCNGSNTASARVIERCGGILEVERYSDWRKETMRRYWIDV